MKSIDPLTGQNFIDPITRQIKDTANQEVITLTYERAALFAWLQEHDSCPYFSNEKLSMADCQVQGCSLNHDTYRQLLPADQENNTLETLHKTAKKRHLASHTRLFALTFLLIAGLLMFCLSMAPILLGSTSLQNLFTTGSIISASLAAATFLSGHVLGIAKRYTYKLSMALATIAGSLLLCQWLALLHSTLLQALLIASSLINLVLAAAMSLPIGQKDWRYHWFGQGPFSTDNPVVKTLCAAWLSHGATIDPNPQHSQLNDFRETYARFLLNIPELHALLPLKTLQEGLYLSFPSKTKVEQWQQYAIHNDFARHGLEAACLSGQMPLLETKPIFANDPLKSTELLEEKPSHNLNNTSLTPTVTPGPATALNMHS